jgi:hypothetical protein
MNRDPIDPAPDPEYDAKMDALRQEADALAERKAKHDADPLYPHQSGDHTIIGPECFTDADAQGIMYRGQFYKLQTEPEPARDRIEMEVVVTATSGIKIPVDVTAVYPEGHGFYAAKVLQSMPEQMGGIWNDLIQRQDESTVKAMLASPNNRGGDDED